MYCRRYTEREPDLHHFGLLRHGEYFIPGQVGLPERRFDPHDPQADHCWFELGADSFSETIEPPTIALTATELVNRFEECRNNWQDEACTPQIGEMNL